MLDLHVHDAHFIRLVCGMPKAVQTVGTMRGEVVERFNTQFIYDPPRMITATCGVIDQQGRPFTHAYEIYLEKATLFFDYAAIAKVGDAVTPLTVLLNDGKVLRPKLGSGDPTDAFVAELGGNGARRAQQHAFAAVGRPVGPRRGGPLPEADRIRPPRPHGQSMTPQLAAVEVRLTFASGVRRSPISHSGPPNAPQSGIS